MPQIFDCKAVAEQIKKQCLVESEVLQKEGIQPKLSLLRVGAKGPDVSYERSILKVMDAAGIAVEVLALPEDISEEDYIKVMQAENADPKVHGILAFRPLDNINEGTAISDCLHPDKDVDASTTANLGRIMMGDKRGFLPCTAAALLAVLQFYNINLDGKNVVIVNRSNVIGKPLSMMLTQLNATVTLCHTHTRDLAAKCRAADILILGLNACNLITEDFVGPHTILLDATTVWQKAVDENGHPVLNEKTGRQRVITRGCCTDAVLAACAAYTPVPGIGGITTSLLARNVIQACRLQHGLEEKESAL